MASPKDPWLAANLSLTIAGLGQLYAGRRISGVIFLLAETASWGMYAAWILVREVPTAVALAAGAAMPILKLVSLIHARRAVLALQGAATPGRNPWLSFFMSRLIPGLGHAYARRWVRAILFLALLVAFWIYQPPERWWNTAMTIGGVLFTLILIDSFLILRDRNMVPRRSTVAFILFFLVAFQHFGLAKLLQTFVVEVYRIPSSAMEPTLMGEASRGMGTHLVDSCPFRPQHSTSSGDRVLVSKLTYLFAPVERYDVVVFTFPLNQSKVFVKRVIGLPDEELMIHHGNIFVKRRGETEFRIASRTQQTQDALWIPVEGDVDSLSSREELLRIWKPSSPTGEGNVAEFAVDRRELSTLEKTAGVRSIRFERRERVDDGHDQEVGELRLAFDFGITGTSGRLFAEIANEFGKFEVSLSTDAASELRVHLPGKTDIMSLREASLVPGRNYNLALSVYDGLASVVLNNREVGRAIFIDRRRDEKISEPGDRFVAFGARDLTFKVRNLTLGRDLYYKGRLGRDGMRIVDDEPLKVPPGHYVMFGDNVENSHDSRSWTQRTFVLADGRKVEAEAQDVENNRTISAEEVMEQYHLERRPTTIVSADKFGNPWALYSPSDVPEGFKPGPFVGVLKEGKDQIGFHFVDEKYFVGRVQKVWWPLIRARAIR